MNYQVDPSVMGVNHNLVEYTATAGNLETIWLALIVLCLVGVVVAMAGFCRTVKAR